MSKTLAPAALGSCGACGCTVTTADDVTLVVIRHYGRTYFHAAYAGCQSALAREDARERFAYLAR